MPLQDTKECTQIFIKEPDLYEVIMLNDDKTTMNFVVQVLLEVFDKDVRSATDIMLNIHTKGSGICGVYVQDIAELKINITKEMAREQGFPLQVQCQKI